MSIHTCEGCRCVCVCVKILEILRICICSVWGIQSLLVTSLDAGWGTARLEYEIPTKYLIVSCTWSSSFEEDTFSHRLSPQWYWQYMKSWLAYEPNCAQE